MYVSCGLCVYIYIYYVYTFKLPAKPSGHVRIHTHIYTCTHTYTHTLAGPRGGLGDRLEEPQIYVAWRHYEHCKQDGEPLPAREGAVHKGVCVCCVCMRLYIM